MRSHGVVNQLSDEPECTCKPPCVSVESDQNKISIVTVFAILISPVDSAVKEGNVQ